MVSIEFNTALCSIFVEIILFTFNDSTTDLIIILFDSVPPLVKIISEGVTFNFSEIYFLESSNNAFELLPNECVEDGLPKLFFITSDITETTSLEICVVAALSK